MSKTWIAITSIVLTMAVMIGGGWVIAHLPSTSANADGPDGSPTASATATVTATATQTPTPGTDKKDQPPVPSAVCRLDKVGTFAEVSSAGPQRIEVGGGGTQHVDFYPDRGVPSVSYIVGPGKVIVAHGFGSIWEGNLPDCAQFKWVADATEYALGNVGNNRPDRLTKGHSGIVIDMRSNPPEIVANALGLNTAQIVNLLAKHVKGMELTDSQKQMLMTIRMAAGVTTPAAGSNTATCSEGTRADHKPAKDTAWDITPTDSFRVVNVWSNQRDPNLGDHKLLLKPGESASLMGGGGAAWSFPASCGDAAQAAYEANTNPAISLAQYKAYVEKGTMP